ncbi:rod shape-determining protein MreC [Altericista sp. CCNU0014]|uniref:rod shape-determining protein MreC n=1 Tax=Altericista sp. CCNU0014 TaxID=3082949 RepID=UPI00384AF371
MKSLLRWWSRYRSALLVALLILSVAGVVRATQGAGVADINRWLVWPFKTDGKAQQRLLDAQSKALQQQIQELEAQNRSLKSLLDLAPLPNQKKIAASVLSRGADNWWQQITLGKGSVEGVRVDAVVVAPGGLVGRVMSVTPNTSRVLLITDPTSQVGITVSRTRQVGILRGRLDRRGVLEFFDKMPDVKKGDAVVTSNLSSRFPGGIAVGRVTELDLDRQPTPQALVEFTVPLEHVEWVSVLVNG